MDDAKLIERLREGQHCNDDYGEDMIRAANRIEQLTRDLAEARAQEQWQPIETAPKDGTFVDLWLLAPNRQHGRRVAEVRWDNNRSFNGGFARVAQPDAWVYRHGGELYLDGSLVTHWQPLPEPPVRSLSDIKGGEG